MNGLSMSSGPLNLTLAVLLSLVSSGCAHVTSASAPDKAIAIPKPPGPALLARSGYLSTVLSNLKALERAKYAEHEVSFTLEDGTRVGGLLFHGPEGAPLLIATFGFLADRWSKPAAQFVGDHLTVNPIGAHVLILDHPSSAPFLVANRALSLGGLDEGRMLHEVARQLRGGQAGRYGLAVRSYHLLGVSIGGLGVLYALDEDRKTSDPMIRSAVIFSGVTRLDEVSPDALVERGSFVIGADSPRWFSLAALIDHRIFENLVAHFRIVYAELAGQDLAWSDDEAARSLYGLFNERATKMGRPGGLAPYMKSTNLCSLGGELQVPIALIHAQDDPLVPVSHARCLEEYAAGNPNVVVSVTENGGHWGFARTYGREWVAAVIERVLAAGRSANP